MKQSPLRRIAAALGFVAAQPAQPIKRTFSLPDPGPGHESLIPRPRGKHSTARRLRAIHNRRRGKTKWKRCLRQQIKQRIKEAEAKYGYCSHVYLASAIEPAPWRMRKPEVYGREYILAEDAPTERARWMFQHLTQLDRPFEVRFARVRLDNLPDPRKVVDLSSVTALEAGFGRTGEIAK